MKAILLLLCLVLLSSTVTSQYWGRRWYDPYSSLCKSGFYLRNPYTRRPFLCDGKWRGCPWPRWFGCQSMTGSDDGIGICCFERGDM
ncbi:uncharacterized protein LOC143078321 [Mytilus galloprovincialis]|uniref:uncharacterized protein LOC143078321 n=1 Tax=Mytilus galloprovincialis TaxID=29158 RepID=UPI003F7BD059